MRLVCGSQGEVVSKGSEVEALKGQISRLQAEKNDLVAMNSELQLKMGQGCHEDSFIEIRIAVSHRHGIRSHFCWCYLLCLPQLYISLEKVPAT